MISAMIDYDLGDLSHDRLQVIQRHAGAFAALLAELAPATATAATTTATMRARTTATTSAAAPPTTKTAAGESDGGALAGAPTTTAGPATAGPKAAGTTAAGATTVAKSAAAREAELVTATAGTWRVSRVKHGSVLLLCRVVVVPYCTPWHTRAQQQQHAHNNNRRVRLVLRDEIAADLAEIAISGGATAARRPPELGQSSREPAPQQQRGPQQQRWAFAFEAQCWSSSSDETEARTEIFVEMLAGARVTCDRSRRRHVSPHSLPCVTPRPRATGGRGDFRANRRRR